MKVKSDFEKIVPEDFEQYKEIAKRFQKVDMTNAVELNELAIESWILASRWSEIQSMASKIGQEYRINKTDFSNWAYQKYRQLQELHITCRSWYRLAVEEEKQTKMIEGI